MIHFLIKKIKVLFFEQKRCLSATVYQQGIIYESLHKLSLTAKNSGSSFHLPLPRLFQARGKQNWKMFRK